MRKQIGEERKEVHGRQRDCRERSQGSAAHGIHVEIRSELNRICSVPADSANVATMRELYMRACVSNEHFHLPFPGTRCTFFSPSCPRTNSAFNCAHRANDIFLLLLCPRSHRTFRFNKILRTSPSTIVQRKRFEETRLREPNRTECSKI